MGLLRNDDAVIWASKYSDYSFSRQENKFQEAENCQARLDDLETKCSAQGVQAESLRSKLEDLGEKHRDFVAASRKNRDKLQLDVEYILMKLQRIESWLNIQTNNIFHCSFRQQHTQEQLDIVHTVVSQLHYQTVLNVGKDAVSDDEELFGGSSDSGNDINSNSEPGIDGPQMNTQDSQFKDFQSRLNHLAEICETLVKQVEANGLATNNDMTGRLEQLHMKKVVDEQSNQYKQSGNNRISQISTGIGWNQCLDHSCTETTTKGQMGQAHNSIEQMSDSRSAESDEISSVKSSNDSLEFAEESDSMEKLPDTDDSDYSEKVQAGFREWRRRHARESSSSSNKVSDHNRNDETDFSEYMWQLSGTRTKLEEKYYDYEREVDDPELREILHKADLRERRKK